MFIAHDPSLGTRAPLGAKYDAPRGLRSEGTITTINITSLRDLSRITVWLALLIQVSLARKRQPPATRYGRSLQIDKSSPRTLDTPFPIFVHCPYTPTSGLRTFEQEVVSCLV